MLLSFKASLLVSSQNKRMSSTNSIWGKESVLPILIYLNEPILFASINSLLIPSTTIKNKSGKRGNHYLGPLPCLKKVDVDPLIRTTNDIEVTQLITKLIKCTQKPK